MHRAHGPPGGPKKPASHRQSAASSDPGGEDALPGHPAHPSRPSAGAYEPAAHGAHGSPEKFAAWNLPAAHSEQLASKDPSVPATHRHSLTLAIRPPCEFGWHRVHAEAPASA